MIQIFRDNELCILFGRKNEFDTEEEARSYLEELRANRIANAPPRVAAVVEKAMAGGWEFRAQVSP